MALVLQASAQLAGKTSRRTRCMCVCALLLLLSSQAFGARKGEGEGESKALNQFEGEEGEQESAQSIFEAWTTRKCIINIVSVVKMPETKPKTKYSRSPLKVRDNLMRLHDKLMGSKVNTSKTSDAGANATIKSIKPSVSIKLGKLVDGEFEERTTLGPDQIDLNTPKDLDCHDDDTRFKVITDFGSTESLHLTSTGQNSYIYGEGEMIEGMMMFRFCNFGNIDKHCGEQTKAFLEKTRREFEKHLEADMSKK
eukprot:TRINITY_DN6884_c0_g1_i1.p1 TRINITY_DN6884_c0_g1~~TRINITY_DN6884_c0_g1_i1.p1  ORF type:complete len:253 (-),score=35.08 TRINITY_DN6884_c0_g1_i1:193-951(-)